MKRWAAIFLLVFLLWWRWQVSQTRFFDVDEFSYLHWAAELVKGQRPYVDFFMFFTPGFLWLFAPLVKLFWMSADVFLAARIVSFVIFLSIVSSLRYLWGITRGWKHALLPAIILAFLPMPYDKFLEVRPDNLATLLAMIGVIGEIRAIRGGKKLWWFVAGVFYSLSLLVFVKTLPFAVVGAIVAIIARRSRVFLAGLAVPTALFFLWAATLGDFGLVWYSLTKLPFEANMIGKLAIMEPHLFFFPNPAFYGAWGMTLPLIANHAIWILGIVMGVYRFFTPFGLAEWLTSGTFLLLVFGYVQFFPLKHSQYLIPIAVFIAYYAADALKKIGKIWVMGVIGGLLILATIQTNQPKLAWTNTMQIAQMRTLTKTIDPDAEVLDLEGRMLYWKDAYVICCVPFGQFEGFLSRRPEVLRAVLEKKRSPYIWQGDTGRLTTVSWEDQQYVRQRYVPVDGWGEKLWKRKE